MAQRERIKGGGQLNFVIAYDAQRFVPARSIYVLDANPFLFSHYLVMLGQKNNYKEIKFLYGKN